MNGFNPLKPTVQTVILYTETQIRRNVSFGTVNNHLTGIKTFLTWHGKYTDVWESPQIKWNRRSAKMVLRSPTKEQSSMKFRDFLICLFLCEEKAHLPIRFGLILCFFGLLRISNVTVPSIKNIDVTRNMLLKDIVDEGDAIKIHVKWSKSNQFGSDTVVLPKAKTNSLCPVKSWRDYKNLYLPADISDNLPLLLTVNNNIVNPITADYFRLVFNKLIRFAEMEGCWYTPHSLRRGGATFLADNEVPITKKFACVQILARHLVPWYSLKILWSKIYIIKDDILTYTSGVTII